MMTMLPLLLSITSFLGGWANWIPLSLGAVILSVIIHNTLLMFAKAFSIRELEAYATSEILQAAATAFMVIFLVFMVGSAMDVSQSLIRGQVQCGATPIPIGTTSNSTMDQAYAAIKCKVQTRAREVAAIQDAILTSSQIRDQFNALNLGMSVFGITFYKGDWVSSLFKATETTRIVNNLATTLLISLNAQLVLLDYLKANMLNVFVPVGILLRTFYFTRSTGALLISIGIGMYFIFPIFFVLLDPGFVASPAPSSFTPQQQAPFCYATMSNTISVLTTVENAGLGSTGGLTLASIRNDLAKSYISLIVHPLIAFSLTMIFIRYIMSVLGGDTYELTKMVSKVI